MNKTLALVFAMVFSLSAFAFGENLNPIQKWLIQEEYKARATGKIKEKPAKARSCVEEFEKAKNKFESNLCNGESRLQEVGAMSGKSFSHDEIENMPAGHPHLRATVRGTNKLVDYWVLGSAPTFPHTYKECENFFTEEVSITTINGKSCREIKFSAPELGGESYTQVYCEGKGTLYISFN